MRKAPVIALLLTAAVACGPAGRANEPPAAPEPSPPGGRLVDPRQGGFEVGFGEWAIQLEAPEIRPGPVTFVIRNGGTMIHGFEIEGEDGSGNELKAPPAPAFSRSACCARSRGRRVSAASSPSAPWPPRRATSPRSMV